MTPPVIVIGGSAGALEPLRLLLSKLPAGVAASVVAVIHLPSSTPSRMSFLLGRVTRLPVSTARNGDPLEPGHVYVPPVDHHLVVHDGHIGVTRSARENGHRPAIDPLFRTAARSLGPRAIGVILSGMLDDGSAGLAAIRAHGGACLVQEPSTCDFADMAENAIRVARPQHVMPVEDMAPVLVRLAEEAQLKEPHPGDEQADEQRDETDATPSEFSCPDCGGVLSHVDSEGVHEYRCRVGHRYSEESLVQAQSDALETAVWAAIRALEEQASLARYMEERASARGDERRAERLRLRAASAEENADIIKERLGVQRNAADVGA